MLGQYYLLIQLTQKQMDFHSYNNSHATMIYENPEVEHNFKEFMPLQQKNRNISQTFNHQIPKSFTKKLQPSKRQFNTKLFKAHYGGVLGQTCSTFFGKQTPLFTLDKQNFGLYSAKDSNIELLKKQIKYLQNQNTDNERFPKPGQISSRNPSITIQSHIRSTQLTMKSKGKSIFTKNYNQSLLFTNKSTNNQALTKQRPGSSQNRQAKKYFSHSKKSARKNHIQTNQFQTTIHSKQNNKFQLIAPFRKYFQSKHNRQNRSCTIKINEIYGKKLQKLSHFTLEEN